MRDIKFLLKKEMTQLFWNNTKRNTTQLPWDGGSIIFNSKLSNVINVYSGLYYDKIYSICVLLNASFFLFIRPQISVSFHFYYI